MIHDIYHSSKYSDRRFDSFVDPVSTGSGLSVRENYQTIENTYDGQWHFETMIPKLVVFISLGYLIYRNI